MASRLSPPHASILRETVLLLIIIIINNLTYYLVYFRVYGAKVLCPGVLESWASKTQWSLIQRIYDFFVPLLPVSVFPKFCSFLYLVGMSAWHLYYYSFRVFL